MSREGAQHALIVLVRTISVVFSSGRPLQLRQICQLASSFSFSYLSVCVYGVYLREKQEREKDI